MGLISRKLGIFRSPDHSLSKLTKPVGVTGTSHSNQSFNVSEI